MDRNLSDLENRINNLEIEIKDIQIILNKLILMIHISDTDLKNQIYLLDS